ncbi:MAG: T9SS type A sorting domain-containing protein [bacterium]
MKKLSIAFLFCFFYWSNSIAQSSSVSHVIDVSDAILDQDNGSVAISRADKNVIVIGAASDFADMAANGMLAFYTADRGATWQSSRLPLPASTDVFAWGAPSVISDDNGTFYYAYLTNDGADSAGHIAVASSTNGGKTWVNAAPVSVASTQYGFPDMPSIWIDRSATSTKNGRIYCAWDQFYSADSSQFKGAYIAWSDDKCKHWSTAKFLGPCDNYVEVRTGKNGEVFVSSSDSIGLSHQLFISKDFGTSFGLPSDIAGFTSYPTYANDTALTILKGITGFAAFPYLSVDVDLASNRIHAVYGDYEGDAASLYYRYSDNVGATWSAAIGISDTSSSDRFDPWVSVDQKTHEAYLFFYSSESDANNQFVAPYRQRLRDSSKERVSTPYNPLVVESVGGSSPYIGDHTASDAFDSVYVGVWTQNRSGHNDGDVYAYISSPKGKSAVPVLVHSSTLWLSPVYPNPTSNHSTSIRYYLPEATDVSFDLFDISGSNLSHLADSHHDEGSYSQQLQLGGIAPGTYIIRLSTSDGQLSQKVIVY